MLMKCLVLCNILMNPSWCWGYLSIFWVQMKKNNWPNSSCTVDLDPRFPKDDVKSSTVSGL